MKTCILIILLSLSFQCLAAEKSAKLESEQQKISPGLTTVKKVNNDDSNYLGDKVSFPVKVPFNTTITPTPNDCYIPGQQTLKSLGLTDGEPERLVVYTDKKIKCVDKNNKETNELIPQFESLVIEKSVLDSVPMNRFGFTYGGLLIPYKYFPKQEEFKGNSTIGPYFGYRFDPSANSFGLGAKLVVFLGAATIDHINEAGKSSSLIGVSYGAGLLGEVKHDFQMGFILGADKVSNSENYENNGKLWMAVAIGFNFAN